MARKACGIIATLGPASDEPSILTAMIGEGLKIARLNFSHGTREQHLARIRTIRRLNARLGSRVEILQDLEGFRIRLGLLGRRPFIEVRKGQTVDFIRGESAHDAKLVPLDYEGPLTDIRPGCQIFIDDGNIALDVVSRTPTRLKAVVLVPGILRPRKGVNIPGFQIPFRTLSSKDQEDLRFGIHHKVDYIAQSFVRDANDIKSVRAWIPERGPKIRVIAKIENADGVRNINSIMDCADGIMVARGDLGVSMPIHLIPVIQKTLIRKCNRRKKFVITATQMLESMTENPRPTRAEVSDVANAVLDGSDFVMLSGETAAGRHPAQTVRTMRDIVRFTEQWRRNPSIFDKVIGKN